MHVNFQFNLNWLAFIEMVINGDVSFTIGLPLNNMKRMKLEI